MPLVAKYEEKEPTPYAQRVQCGLPANCLGNTEKCPEHSLKITAERFAYNF